MQDVPSIEDTKYMNPEKIMGALAHISERNKENISAELMNLRIQLW